METPRRMTAHLDTSLARRENEAPSCRTSEEALMRARSGLWLVAAAFCVSETLAQSPGPAAGMPARTVSAYVLTLEIKALAPELKTPDKAPGEAEALMSRLRERSQLVTRVFLAQDLSR